MPTDKHASSVVEMLTPLARTILNGDGEMAYVRLVVTGEAENEGGRLLKGLRPEQLLARPVVNAESAAAVLAGLWLWRDRLAESHAISQSLVSMTGSFWHAIMHRREGDFSNAKYWYARCKTHSVMRTIAVGATPILGQPDIGGTQGMDMKGVDHEGWDPFGFVNWVERVHDRPDDPGYAAAVEVQRLEWRALFAESVFAAVGAGTVLGGGIEA